MQGKAHRAGNRDSEKRTQQKAHAAVSDSRRPPVKVTGPRSYGWRNLYNLSFLVSSNLPRIGRQQGAQLRDSGEAAPQHVPKALSAEPQ